MKKLQIKLAAKMASEKGFSLLEYCAGAAIIAGVVWAATGLMGEGIAELLQSIGNWASTRAGEIGQ
jgi:hypothetical protein